MIFPDSELLKGGLELFQTLQNLYLRQDIKTNLQIKSLKGGEAVCYNTLVTIM